MASAPGQPASLPPSWWQRTCRWLRRVLRWFWVSVVFVLVMAVLPSLLLLTPGTPSPYIFWFWFNWVLPHLPVAIMVLLGLVGLTILSWVGSREGTTNSSLSPDQQSRVDALKVLRKAYTDELAASLQGMACIPLGLHERFDLTHPARLSSRQAGQSERALPDGTTIVDAYDQAGNGLLILGEPGAGKSMLLYDLAQALLSRAERNEQHRLPVILNLFSWATSRLPLETWFVGELHLRYLIPRQLSQRWEQQGKLLLLLDGLDEVAGSARDACVEAINTYHSVRLVPLVVCSRQGEYEALAEQLTLQSAVVAQPLATEQVKAYLKDAGRPFAAVRKVVDTNIVLRGLLTTPLMLSVVALTYRDTAVKDLPQLGTPEQQQQQIFEHYIERMLGRPTTRGYFTPQQTRQWLTWLAQRMQQFSLTEFYLEWLQPTWLATERAQAYYTWFFRLVFGLVFGLVGGPVGELLGGLLFERVSDVQITKDLRRRPNQGISSSGRNALLFGLVFGLLGGLLFGLSTGLSTGLVFGLLGGLLFGLVVGGAAYLGHYLLRFLLWRSGAMPWHYVRFLEEATKRILLQRVGGGYRFIHPLFQEYFASLGTGTSASVQSHPPASQP